MEAQFEALSELAKSGETLTFGQDFFVKFYQAFLYNDRWLQYVEGVGTTLVVTAMALVLGVVLGSVVALVRVAHDQQRPHHPQPGAGRGQCDLPDLCHRHPRHPHDGAAAHHEHGDFRQQPQLHHGRCAGAGHQLGRLCVGDHPRRPDGGGPPARWKRAAAWGLNYITTMVLIIIPQAIRSILPSLGNEFIILLKDTSLITVIGGKELLYAAQGIMNRTYEAMFPLLGVAAIYLVLVLLFSALLGKLERRLAQSDRR